jgi:hypothetical protein
MELIR